MNNFYDEYGLRFGNFLNFILTSQSIWFSFIKNENQMVTKI